MSETSSLKKSRTRSGCLTCRDRHMKCDEGYPVCMNCIRSKRHCMRGMRLNFTRCNVFRPPAIPGSEGPKSYRILDHSITVASQFKNGRSRYRHYLQQHTPEELWESDARFQQGGGLLSIYFKLARESDDPAFQRREGLSETTRSGSYNALGKREKEEGAPSFSPEILNDNFLREPTSTIPQKRNITDSRGSSSSLPQRDNSIFSGNPSSERTKSVTR